MTGNNYSLDNRPELEILFRDEFYIAVNKPSGILVHPYKSETSDKLNILKLLRDQENCYPYPIHRLDRPVSGVLLFALDSNAAGKMKEIWQNEQTKKTYHVLCWGKIPEVGKFDFALRNEQKVSQDALTKYKKIKGNEKYSYAEVEIKTGRRHQIRRHFSRKLHFILGDTKYGKGRINREFRDQYNFNRIFLHAYSLEFIHPYTQKKEVLTAPLPIELSQLIEKLF